MYINVSKDINILNYLQTCFKLDANYFQPFSPYIFSTKTYETDNQMQIETNWFQVNLANEKIKTNQTNLFLLLANINIELY